jgi:hypothetical protein
VQNLPYLVRKMNNVLFHPAKDSSGNNFTEDVLVLCHIQKFGLVKSG